MEGNGTLACITDGGAKGTISVRVAWDYEFSLNGTTTFSITPVETKTIGFSVNPSDADIHVDSNYEDYYYYEINNNGDGTGSILITPKKEYASDINIKISATNPNKEDDLIGEKILTASFKYDTITILPVYVKSNGKYSKLVGDSIFVGDGETLELLLNIQEKNSDAVITEVGTASVGNNSEDVKSSKFDTNSDFSHILLQSIEDDYIVYDSYRINSATRPEYYPDAYGGVTYFCSICGESLLNEDDGCKTESCWDYDDENGDSWLGSVVKVDNGYTKGTRTVVSDWKTSLEWTTYNSYQYWTSRAGLTTIKHTGYIGYVGIISLDYSKREVEDTTPSKSVKPMDYDYQESKYRWCTWIDCVGGQDNHKLGFYWDRINIPEETGKIYTKNDFESIAWWYCPGLSITHSNGSQHGAETVTWDEGIVTENVDATPLGTDTKIISEDCNQQLIIKYNHNGKAQTPIKLNVYYSKRSCNMDYSE